MITDSRGLYAWSQPLLRPLVFGHRRETAAEDEEDQPAIDVIVFGLGATSAAKQITDLDEERGTAVREATGA